MADVEGHFRRKYYDAIIRNAELRIINIRIMFIFLLIFLLTNGFWLYAFLRMIK